MKVACPQCGGETQVETPDSFISCSFCQASLFIDLESVTPVFTFSPEIESQRVPLYLKQDFDKVGIGQLLVIREVLPLYLPFWGETGQNLLRRASSIFPAERIPAPAGTRRCTDPDLPPSPEFALPPIDLQPPENKRQLFLVPFYDVRVSFRDHIRRFFVSAVSGNVYGERLAVLPQAGTGWRRLVFPAFLFSMLAVNWLFDHVIVALLSNLLILALFYPLFANGAPTAAKRR
jgi:hypothetical protein